MAQQHLPYINLDSIVSDYLLESEQNQNKYFKIWHLLFRGMEICGLDFFYKVNSVKLPVAANKTVSLPPNYLNWIKVGIENATGGVIPLYYNENLNTYADLSPDRLEKVNDPQSLWLQWDWAWQGNTWANWGGYGAVGVFGVPSGEPFVGSFKVDTPNGVILLNEWFNRDYIILEYLCSPQEGQEYYVPMQFREALIAWLWWKDSKGRAIKSHMQLGNNRDLKHEFYNERRNAVARWKPTRIMDGYQASQEQSRLAVKT